MGCKPKTRHFLVRALALTLAVLSVLLLAQALSHTHEKGQTEATCQVCQAVRIGSVPTAVTQLLMIPILETGCVLPFSSVFHEDILSQDSPSRAPPFVLL